MPMADDATLTALSLSGVDLNVDFDADTKAYTASVANDQSSVTITAEPADGAEAEITPADADGEVDGHQVSLAEGVATTITIVVTEGDDSETYTVVVTRATVSGPTDATLRALSLSGITLKPAFAAAIEAYTADVGNIVSLTTVMATPNNPQATVVIDPPDGDGGTTGHQVSDFVVATAKIITVTVTAPDSTTTKTYTVAVTRLGLSDVATLSALSLSGIPLDPAFAAATEGYTEEVANNVASTTVTAMATYPQATFVITPEDADDKTAGHQVNLVAGTATNIVVEVTAENGTTTKRYTVAVTRLALSADATLKELKLTDVTLDPEFDAADLTYTDDMVANSVTSTTVTATATHAEATVNILPGRTVSLPVGQAKRITVVVTAENGSASQTYAVTVTRLADKSADATLSALSLKDVTLDQTFNAATDEYTASVAKEVTSTTVTAKATHSHADVVITPGKNVNLTASDDTPNTITVKVTAEDGTTTETYTVKVTRAEKSEISSLSGILLSGVMLDQTFGPARLSYTNREFEVPNSGSSTTVTVSKTNAQSRVVITPVDGNAGTAGHQVALEVPTTVITIVVTPESGNTDNATTYTVTVTRAAAG